MTIIALVIAALSGIAMAVQGSLNTTLGEHIGLLAGTFLVHVIGSIFGFTSSSDRGVDMGNGTCWLKCPGMHI